MAFKTLTQLGQHFPFKDRVEDPGKQSNEVYYLERINCEGKLHEFVVTE